MGEAVSGAVEVYGIGNPLIDVIAQVSERELAELNVNKGSMTLIDTERGNTVLSSIDDREKMYSCGGSAPNTMIMLAALGVRTALAGMVGNDRLGEIYQKRLQEKKVVSHLAVGEGDTGTSIILVTPDHERTMNTRLGVCQTFGPGQVNHQTIAEAKYLYFTGYMWDTEPQKDALVSAIETARKSETQVVFDLADPFAVERHYQDFLALIRDRIDILLANREEARLLVGIDDPETAARELAGTCRVAAVKNSAEGSFVATRQGECVAIPAFTVDAVDSTGAGDNFAAGFLYGLIREHTLAEAGLLASYIAGQIVRQVGAQFDEQGVHAIRHAIHEGHWHHPSLSGKQPGCRSASPPPD